jgi:hypothetical protein
MIKISSNHYIGEGEIRKCYVHPKNENLCIKIPRTHIDREYTNKEIVYFKKLNSRKSHPLSFYSNFHEEIETNYGMGQVFDLVRDETTHDISKTLEYYLLHPNLLNMALLEDALQRLKANMIAYKVFARDLRARNLCCKLKLDATVDFVIVDGIGHRDFLPLADWFHFFSKKKIERTFNKWHFQDLKAQTKFLKSEK